MSINKESKVRVLCSTVSRCEGRQVAIQGWVHGVRHLGQVAFMDVRDRSGIVQCVLEGEWLDLSLTLESVVAVHGRAVPAAKAANGVEIHADRVEVLNRAASPLPFDLNKKHLKVRLETMLDHRVLSLRHRKAHSIFTIQSALAGAFREYLTRDGFTQIFTPKIVASGTEGGSNLFPINYFEHTAYLAQSPQFYKQMMVGAGYERVFEIGPVYRAEEHNTSRHLNEYISLDAEVGFIRSEEELMDLEQEMLKHMFDTVARQCEDEFNLLEVESLALTADIPRMTVAEAHRILEWKYGKLSPKGDLDPEGERLLCQYVAENNQPGLVFLTRYPREIRPLYAMPAADEPELTASFDLLMGGLEITTGGQRIHELEQLIASIRSRGLNPEHFDSYLELFRYGMPPHGGFAIGLERLTSRLLGLGNVREASAFPRDRNRLTP
ncbi:aspartate--tRNA(Asn) ligase [Paenibacillus thiaminolyticus]|uniref:Aspartate--tRNA ligase n=1 Tax=Paenibacillus thiaminolyticus TaxID=49283 RepID=A0AAP9DRM6_PANTH|nr:aspartate--tRNA(Asn) ligase [Paenibacillus thiaminolyticus]MCY9536012.1 aspartate--tRNA(Asn) ligase [Paenibacillus thiaminolyticus]MCY9602327.1 aspartate--tRNA(Asn) ligase [Paenibacillus thiaminolyticus]MCY9608722.1 aspartate--tRNA(Asn) ligase [Paenibacillus thiaminolyticus]MCY9613468.1 aspartate--tRNA(Asn) ligase [Paenibacillus thiaminolyticus]MCY9620287.1 aspartate--tRNA(Asn) ligase [Paenibacillus thiaminolyticus]